MFFDVLAAPIVVQEWHASSGGVDRVRLRKSHVLPYLQSFQSIPPLFFLVCR